MIPRSLKKEWFYRYEERIAIMCGTGTPTDRQVQIAKMEADEAVGRLEDESLKPLISRP